MFMKRDLELIRKILLFFDAKPGSECVETLEIPGYDELSIKYHLVLLNDAGFLRCEEIKSTTSNRIIYVVPFDLTWGGHEFLDKIRDQYVWDEVKNKINEKGFVSASIDFVKKLADAAIKRKLEVA